MKLRMYILFILFATFVSCSKKDNVKFTSNVPEEYEINYSKDTMKIVFKYLKSNTIDTLVYAKIANDFFEIDKNRKNLFFSTSKDTLFSINDGSFLYKTEIKKNKDLSFKTSTILVNDLGKEVLLSSFYYDKNYRILKIEKQATAIFLPQEK